MNGKNFLEIDQVMDFIEKNIFHAFRVFPQTALYTPLYTKDELLFSIYWYAQVIELSGSVDKQAMIAIAKTKQFL